MRLLSYRVKGDDRYGAATAGGIVDLKRRLPQYPNLKALIAAEGTRAAREIIDEAESGDTFDHRLADVQLLPPILEPEKVWCIGVNYADRNAEYKDASEQPRYPSLFARSIRSFVGHDEPIERPTVSEQLDYEGEIALVIGRPGRHLSPDTALDHVFGLTLCNEGTVRDWLRHGKFNVTQGKNFDRSGSLGPWIVTADAIDLKAPLVLTTRVNGAVRQHDTTARLMFSFVDLLVYLSTFATPDAGRYRRHGDADGRGRSARSAAMARAARYRRGRGAGDRHPAESCRR